MFPSKKYSVIEWLGYELLYAPEVDSQSYHIKFFFPFRICH